MTLTPPSTRSDPLPRVVCAWCGSEMRPGDPEAEISHGICAPCLAESGVRPTEDLFTLDPDSVDRLPYGVLHLDEKGVVRHYNRTEAQFARRDLDEVLGRNFFTDVAPCTAVREYEGRFRRMVTAGVPARDDFEFVFRFSRGEVAVRIVMVHSPEDRQTMILVEPLDESDR